MPFRIYRLSPSVSEKVPLGRLVFHSAFQHHAKLVVIVNNSLLRIDLSGAKLREYNGHIRRTPVGCVIGNQKL